MGIERCPQCYGCKERFRNGHKGVIAPIGHLWFHNNECYALWYSKQVEGNGNVQFYIVPDDDTSTK